MTEFDLICFQLADSLLSELTSQGVDVATFQNLITVRIVQLVAERMTEYIPAWISLGKASDEAATFQEFSLNDETK